MDERSSRLLARWQEGDEQAAEEIFDRYVKRLVGLARKRLSPKMQRRVDPEDVVQSAYRCFFDHAREERFTLKQSGDLWRLLAGITVKKTQKQVEFQRAGKRSIDLEASVVIGGSSYRIPPEILIEDSSPSDAAALVEELEAVMQTLAPVHRRILQLRLSGTSVEEIANETQRSERTVHRVLDNVQETLERRLANGVLR